MSNITDIRKLHAARKSTSNNLTDDQQELLLYAEYSVKMALIELSELNIAELRLLGEHGETLECEIDKAISSIKGSKQLIQSLLTGNNAIYGGES